jgi:hypothetical protein
MNKMGKIKVNKEEMKKLASLTIAAAIITVPSISFAAGEMPIVSDMKNAIDSVRENLVYIIPSATAAYLGWHALNGVGGDAHKKSELKDKVKTGLLWGAVGTAGAALVNWFYGFF